MRKLRHRLAAGAAAVAVLVGGGTAAASAEPPEGVVTAARSPVPGRYIVELAGSSSASAAPLTQRYGGRVTAEFRLTFSGFAVSEMTERQARRLAADPSVKAVHQDGTARALGEQPNPPSWGLDQVDQKTLTLDKLYKYPNTADAVTAYVIDSGVHKAHSEFEGRASDGYDFVDNDAVAQDCYWHGTHVAGTIAGRTVGVAKKAKIVGVRSLGCGGAAPDSATVSALEWVAQNGKLPAVVNLSLAMDTLGVGDAQVKALVAKGFVVNVAGGNNGGDACQTSPARVPEAITVGWMNQGGSRSGNYGTCLDLFAPGGSIHSADHTGGYRQGSGTSMATPHVAGAAALYLAANPGATPAQVRDALVGNATPNLVTSPGTGSPNKLLYTGFIGGGGGGQCTAKGNDTDVAVPDASSATSVIEQSGCTGSAPASLAVRVDIDHTYPGDLSIDLVGPGGRQFPLRRAKPAAETGGVHQTFQVDASSEAANGTWTLRVTDVNRYDTGTLTGWSLTF